MTIRSHASDRRSDRSHLAIVRLTLLLASLTVFVGTDAALAQPASDPSRLTLDRLFASGEFNGQGGPAVVWSETRSDWFEVRHGAQGNELVRVDPADGSSTVVATAADLTPAGSDRPIGIEEFELSADERRVLIFTEGRRVWRYNTRGDWWVLDLDSRRLKQLGGDAPPSSLMFARFSPDGSQVAYVRQNDLWVESVADDSIVRLTDDGSETIVNGTSDWVNEEELDIRDAFRWSPDGTRIAYLKFDTSEVPRFTIIDNTSSKYPQLTTFPYPKVGERNSAIRVGIVSASGGATTSIDLPGDPREHYVPQFDWIPGNGKLAIQQFDRLQQNLRVFVAEPSTGKVAELLHESDSAWVDNLNPFRWLDGGASFVWLSERSGWKRPYLVSTADGSLREIGSESWDVIEIKGIDRERRTIWVTASPGDAPRCYLYAIEIDSGRAARVTPAEDRGWHDYSVSPDGRWATHSYSKIARPPIHELISLPDHATVRVTADNAELREKLATLAMPTTELTTVVTASGIECDAWLMTPPDLDPNRRYPILVYVYGEPWGQTVRDAWDGRRGLWHAMLAQHGYVVMSIENRGTRVPKGRDWRRSIYRRIGIIAPQDQAEALEALCESRPWLDPSRVAIWGWSGGGSMTLNALFRYPDRYHLGMSVAPEPNQLLYDTIYQERYMGLPDDNAEGYRDGSPVNHAARLEGELLIVHGTGDDNCHYQGTELLIDQLVAAGKSFSVMPYPGVPTRFPRGEERRGICTVC
jgi:dipeptidyl-peptidase 4